MSRVPGRRTSAANLRWLVSVLALAGPAAAGAQAVQPPATEVPPSPVAEAPLPTPFTTQDPGQSAPGTVPEDLPAGVSRVLVIAAPAAGEQAVPPPGWSPPTDNSGAVTLEARPGQPLDAAWVQAQFDRATGPAGIRPSTAIALVQLINRAFVTAGFINSGLLVAARPSLTDPVLQVRLVYGQLASSDPAASAVTVEWGDKRSGGLTESYVRNRFPSLAGQPLSALELERDFRLLDESPAIRSISAALRPGGQPGEASLRLIVHPADRFDFYMGGANDRSPSVGGDRAFAGGLARNLIASGDLLTAEAGMDARGKGRSVYLQLAAVHAAPGAQPAGQLQ